MILPKTAAFTIGGYFALELPSKKKQLYPLAKKFQSARAAFLALLLTGRPARVWMPRYICDAMLTPLQMANIESVLYDLKDDFNVADTVEIKPNDWLLYVNYFGVCSANISELVKRFPSNQLVLDFSQSFFEPPPNVLATIYSPRKFFGIPDGGLLVSQVYVKSPEVQDVDSLGRVSHLLWRLAEEPETGYIEYQKAEKSLSDCTPKQMSKLTEKILSSIDYNLASKRRLKNFKYFNKRLGADNLMQLDLENIIFAPLCYPFATHDVSLRKRLIDNKIFIATYWNDAISRVNKKWAESMIWNCLPLPIDQRYRLKDIDRIISVVHGNGI